MLELDDFVKVIKNDPQVQIKITDMLDIRDYLIFINQK